VGLNISDKTIEVHTAREKDLGKYIDYNGSFYYLSRSYSSEDRCIYSKVLNTPQSDGYEKFDVADVVCKCH